MKIVSMRAAVAALMLFGSAAARGVESTRSIVDEHFAPVSCDSCCDDCCCGDGDGCGDSCCGDPCCEDSCCESGGCGGGGLLGNGGIGGGALHNSLMNSVLWSGWDAVKGVGDGAIPPGGGTGFMNSSGALTGFNSGFKIRDSGIHGQVGGSVGVYDLYGRDTADVTRTESQYFLTMGVYKRSDILNGDRIAWGVVHDQFGGDNYGLRADTVYLSQFRGLVGYALSNVNEVGFWGTTQLHTDHITNGTPPVLVHAANQGNLFWKHAWESGASTTAYTGFFDRAGTNSWSFGLIGLAPLNDRTSLYGNFAYVTPRTSAGAIAANDAIWNVGAGIQFAFGANKGRSYNVSGPQGLPLLNVANNSSFLITR